MLVGVVFMVMCIWTVHGVGMFEDKTANLPDGTLQLNYGVAVTNVGDGKGPLEWVIAGFSGPNIVLQLDEASGKYINIAQVGSQYEALRDEAGAAIGVCACDIDGDGLEEIYFLNTNNRYSGPKLVKDRLYKWRNNRYEDLFEDDVNDGVSNMFAGRSVACVDRTGNGKYGILLATYAENKQGKFGLIEMNEASANNDVNSGRIVLHNVAEEAGVDFTTGGRGIAVGPILGNDGFSDIYFVNEGNYRLQNRGDNALFKNDGQGHFTNVASELNLADNEPGRGVALADFNNDGKTDIVYGNWVDHHKLMIQGVDGSGNPTFTNAAATSNSDFQRASPIRTVIAADFDNSGMLQVFMNNIVYRGVDASNRLYMIEPDGTSVIITRDDIGDALETNEYGTGAAVSDTDGDGVLELLISHGESRQQSLSFYHVSANRASGNNWLRILPLTQYGAPARGSKITIILQDGTKLSRISDGGSGYLCEMEPVAHFGLGQGKAKELTVTWPDGHSITKTLSEADMNRMHEISFTGEITTIEGRGRRNEGQGSRVSYDGISRSLEGQDGSAGDTSSQDSRSRSQRPRIEYTFNTYGSRDGSRSRERNYRRYSSSQASDSAGGGYIQAGQQTPSRSNYRRYQYSSGEVSGSTDSSYYPTNQQTPVRSGSRDYGRRYSSSESTARRYPQQSGQTYESRYTQNYGQQGTGRERSQSYGSTSYRNYLDRYAYNARRQGYELQYTTTTTTTQRPVISYGRQYYNYERQGSSYHNTPSRSSYWNRQGGSAYHSGSSTSEGTSGESRYQYYSRNPSSTYRRNSERHSNYPTYYNSRSYGHTSSSSNSYPYTSEQNDRKTNNDRREYRYQVYNGAGNSNPQNVRGSTYYGSTTQARPYQRSRAKPQAQYWSAQTQYYQPSERAQTTGYSKSVSSDTRYPESQSRRRYQYSYSQPQTSSSENQRRFQVTGSAVTSSQGDQTQHNRGRALRYHGGSQGSTVPDSGSRRYSKYYKSDRVQTSEVNVLT